jgi:hypothetical protein
MLRGISPRINKDGIFQTSEMKNPLKVILSEGHTLERASMCRFSVALSSLFMWVNFTPAQ